MNIHLFKFFLVLQLLSVINCVSLRAERIFDVVIDDGTSPTKSYAFIDTITEKNRIIEVNREGILIWEAEINQPSNPRNICRGADIEYLRKEKVFRALVPFTSITEVSRDKKYRIVLEDNEISHDFDTLENGNILYSRGWVNKGEIEFIEVDSSGEIVFSWNGSKVISDNIWKKYAKIGFWPKKWNSRLKTTQKGEDWLHINSVQKLIDGTYMVSSPNLNSILILSKIGKIIRWIDGANIVHAPVVIGDKVMFSEKNSSNNNKGLIERIVTIGPMGREDYLLEGKFRAIRGIEVLEDGWLSLTSSGQIIEIDVHGNIRRQLKLTAQNRDHENNSKPYKNIKTYCGSGMGTLYNSVAIK